MHHNIDIEELFLDNDVYHYFRMDEYHNIRIKIGEGVKTKIVIVGKANYQLDILLEENSSLVVNSLNKNNSVNVSITLDENSEITYNHSVMCNNIDSVNYFNIHHLKNNSISTINNNGVNMENNKLFFTVDGIIPSNLFNISCNQNNKIINFKDGFSKIIPNLIIDSNDIVANHSAYIGKVDDNEKFYLASRGLNEKSINKLVYTAVMHGKMECQEEKEEFNKLINEWW